MNIDNERTEQILSGSFKKEVRGMSDYREKQERITFKWWKIPAAIFLTIIAWNVIKVLLFCLQAYIYPLLATFILAAIIGFYISGKGDFYTPVGLRIRSGLIAGLCFSSVVLFLFLVM